MNLLFLFVGRKEINILMKIHSGLMQFMTEKCLGAKKENEIEL